MQEVFWLQPDNSLTVEAIRNILGQQIILKYAPGSQMGLLPKKGGGNVISFSEISSYALGFGAEVPAEITRIMLLLLADFMSKQATASAPAIIARILEFNQFEVFPQVFTQGLFTSPAAHVLLPVFGAGKVYYQGYLLNAADVHDIFSWQPLTWPEDFSAPLWQTSFLRLAGLVFSFIQFQKLKDYGAILFAGKNFTETSHPFFRTQTENLASQIEIILNSPENHPTHLPDLELQLNKLLTTFGEHIFAYFADQNLKIPEFWILQENFKISLNLLFTLQERLNQENLVLFENSCNSAANNTSDNGSIMPAYQILQNLEQMMAIATLIEFPGISINPEFKKNQNSHWATLYRNQVIGVLKDANFAELTRKTVTFIYATSQTYKPIA